MKKRGQLTIFIIIAILIIAVVVLFFTFRGSLQIPGKPVSPETAEIQNFVQGCLDDSLEKVVFRIGENGGYYFPERAPAKTEILEVSYYIKNNKNLMLSKEEIETEISKYVTRDLIFCLGDFALFPEYQITKGKMSPPKVVIEPEKVLIEINYPLTIIKGESRSKIEDFNSETPVRLGIVYNAVSEFILGNLATSGGTCMSCLLEITEKNDLYASTFDYDNKTTIFIISDFNSIINKKEFVYIFANEK